MYMQLEMVHVLVIEIWFLGKTNLIYVHLLGLNCFIK